MEKQLLVVEVGTLTFICILVIDHRERRRRCVVGSKSPKGYGTRETLRDDDASNIERLQNE